jgi:hypothetical protein
MKQFIMGTEQAFQDLEQRANRSCVRFRAQEMPPGSTPGAADVGFEINQSSGAARLYVTSGTSYGGTDSSVREWLRTGIKEFSSFKTLVEWIRGPLAQAFGITSRRSETGSEEEVSSRRSSELTDLSAVRDAIQEIHKPLYLDENTLFEKMRAHVLGQDGALKALAAVIVRHCARRKSLRPAVVFAIGPSGVGKTRTAEILAKVLREFDAEEKGYQFLRLDMNEYQEAHRVSQLIGAPQGYVGHGEGSQLLDTLRANPRTIVLFDEIEKANPAILRVLMNAMDAGRLSTADRSSTGREIDCRQAVFMFTSNLDSKEILEELENRNGFGNSAAEDEVCRRRIHAAGIAPEIVGRIGRFLLYRPLSPDTRAEIVTLAVAEVAEEYGLKVAHVDPQIIVDLMQKAKSQNFGVRPERFLIDEVLGGTFVKAAEQGISNPVDVLGPPYVCNSHSVAATSSVVQDNDSGGSQPQDLKGVC